MEFNRMGVIFCTHSLTFYTAIVRTYKHQWSLVLCIVFNHNGTNLSNMFPLVQFFELYITLVIALPIRIANTSVIWSLTGNVPSKTHTTHRGIARLCTRYMYMCKAFGAVFTTTHTLYTAVFHAVSHIRSGSALDSWNLTPAPHATTVCMVAWRVFNSVLVQVCSGSSGELCSVYQSGGRYCRVGDMKILPLWIVHIKHLKAA